MSETQAAYKSGSLEIEHELKPVEIVPAGTMARLARLERANRWIPISEGVPEDDGDLKIDDCVTWFDGNENLITSCSFWCKFTFDAGRQESCDVVEYNFDHGSWELKFEGELMDIVVTHYRPLPDWPEVTK